MDIVIIANAWGAGISNPTSKHRIALELVRRGCRVLWIEGSGMRTPRLSSGHDRLRVVRKVLAALRGPKRVSASSQGAGRLWVLSPLFLPFPRYEAVRQLNGAICTWTARFWSAALGLRMPVLINYVPVLAEAMKNWGGRREAAGGKTVISEQRSVGSEQNEDSRGSSRFRRSPYHPPPSTLLHPRVVYHCVDRWDAFKMYDAAVMSEMDQRCCRYADLVIASSAELYERCLALNPNTRLLTHGVDYEHFAKAVEIRRNTGGVSDLKAQKSNGVMDPSTLHPPPSTFHLSLRPADLPPAPIIGFFGLLSEWIDQELLLGIADAMPSAQLVLIGQPDVSVDRLKKAQNVHLLGPRPFAELPRYVAWFDVGMIPFEVNDLTRSVNPIKLREMLSAGCPVVSTNLPEVARYADSMCSAVSIADSREQFIEQVRWRVENPATNEERTRISAGMAVETWERKVDEMSGMMAGEKELLFPSAPGIGNQQP